MSQIGTFETCRRALRTSVDRADRKWLAHGQSAANDPSQTSAAGRANRDFDRRATPGGLFSALTGTNGSTNFKRQRDDNQGSNVNVAGSKRCLLSRRTLASRSDPRSGGAVIA